MKFIPPKYSQKIDALFNGRLVEQLALAVLNNDQYMHWRMSAMAIQEDIYNIDSYYESHGTLSAPVEQPMWAAVESRIRESNGSGNIIVWRSFEALRQYGQIESRIHAFDQIDPRELSHIAGLKASDVRIARALIWSYGTAVSQSVLDFWASYDECGELIEDLADVVEDGRDWNFNFWLYSYMAGGNVARSIDGASQALGAKLASLEAVYLMLPDTVRYKYADVVKTTLRAGRKTLRQSGTVYDLIAQGGIWRYGEHHLIETAA